MSNGHARLWSGSSACQSNDSTMERLPDRLTRSCAIQTGIYVQLDSWEPDKASHFKWGKPKPIWEPTRAGCAADRSFTAGAGPERLLPYL